MAVEDKATSDVAASIRGREVETADVDLQPRRASSSGEDEHGSPDEEVLGADQVNYAKKPPGQNTWKLYLRIFTYSTAWDRLLLSIAFLGEIATGTTLPLMGIVFGHLTGHISGYTSPDGSTPDAATVKAEFLANLRQQTLYIVYLFIARWVLSYISMLIFRMAGIKMSARLRHAYLEALFKLPIRILDTLPLGGASNTITTAANILQVGISDKLGSFVQFMAMSIASIVIAFTFSWSLTLVTCSGILFIGLVYGSVLPVIMKLDKEVQHADAQASSVAGEVLGSIRMIVACGAEDRVAKKFAGWVQESRRRGLRASPFTGIQFAPLFFSIYATFALSFWEGFRLYLGGHIESIGTIVIVLNAVTMLAFTISQTVAPIMAAAKAASAASNFFAIIDIPATDTSGLKEPEVSADNDILFNSITFAYPSRPHVKVLDDLNLKFALGQNTAIVGASGSGKSTIVGLLERWYDLNDEIPRPEIQMKSIDEIKGEKNDESDAADKTEDGNEQRIPLSGSITVGGGDLSSFDVKWWRSQIGLVQQEPFIFNDTIANNIAYGLIGTQWENESAETKQSLVKQACKEAFADEFINRLPLRYDTPVGEAGIKLSGGQRQRLAIARSIIKRPKILILDEATSAIDVKGERVVQAALNRVSKGRTTITIAHRLSTIKQADKIVVLRKGRVVEEGTHAELLDVEGGAYWTLVNAQQLSMDDSPPMDVDDAEVIDSVEKMNTNTNDVPVVTEIEEAYKRKSFYTSFGLLIYEQRYQWHWFAILLAATMAAGAVSPLQAYLFAQLITVIGLDFNDIGAASAHWALMFFILAIGSGVAYFCVGWSGNTTATKVSTMYRQEYFGSVLAKPIAFYDAEENSSGTLTARIANDPTQLQQLLGVNMAMSLQAIFSLIGSIIIAFVFGYKLTCVAVFVTLPIIMAGAFFRFRYEIQFEAMNQKVFAESSKFASEAIGAFRTVTSLTLEDMISQRYNVLLQDHVDHAFKKARFSSMVFALSDSINLACMALAFYYGGTLVASGEYTPIAFFVIYIAVINGSESAGSFLSFGPNFAQASQAANRILAFRTSKMVDEKSLAALQDTEGGVKIELKDVWFKYPTRDVPIFKGLNLTIEKGQFAAFVGASGSGKTSIISLLERFYEPEKGKILCNGDNIAKVDVKAYRETVSLVAQEPTLYQGTIRENIMLGVHGSTTQAKLHQACREAEIHDFIMSLPEGYDTDVGSKGIALSGGQKQRISIARALIRDPKILLLDEATSSLDSESEKLVQKAFEEAGKKGRTMVVVAHRLATIQKADVIFVIGEGKVVESGTHTTLLRQKGVYYQMCQSQALDR